MDSSALVDQQQPGEAVISLDGTTLGDDQLSEVRNALANEVPEDISRP